MAREHEGRFGKFYSEWAFDEQSDLMASRNHEVYDALTGRWTSAESAETTSRRSIPRGTGRRRSSIETEFSGTRTMTSM